MLLPLFLRCRASPQSSLRVWLEFVIDSVIGLALFFASSLVFAQGSPTAEQVSLAPVPEIYALSTESLNYIEVPGVISQPVQPEQDFAVHGQSTWYEQRKNNFNSPYHSGMSLLSQSDGDSNRSYTWSSTLYLGARLWRGGEFYYNPEFFMGSPFSGNLQGLGGVQNGELQKGNFPTLTFYNARTFIRQTWDLNEDLSYQGGSASNDLAGYASTDKLVLTFGKFASLDIFDQNVYSHDPRTQFSNFSLFSMAAYGYAADSKGFTYGLSAELYEGAWTFRVARLALPTAPNILQLDYTLLKDYVNQIEVTHQHFIGDHPGQFRGILFYQHALMATYQDAILQGEKNGTVPDILTSRLGSQTMYGYGLNVEQELTKSVGVFARFSWNNDQTETQTLDVGRSLSGGLSVKGSAWGRAQDTLGVGYALNAISQSEINYLQLGGQTMFIGDGALSYKPEMVSEAYYSLHLSSSLFVTADYQRIANPAYNGSRGPVNILGFRMHVDF